MLGAGRLALAAADAVAGLFGIGEAGFPLVLDGLGLAEHPQLVPDAEIVRDVHPHGAGHTVPAAGAADLDAAVQEGGGLLHRGGLVLLLGAVRREELCAVFAAKKRRKPSGFF